MLILPWSGGRDPLLMSNDWGPTSELADVWHKFMGVEWKKGDGGRQMHSGEHVHLHSWSCDLLQL